MRPSLYPGTVTIGDLKRDSKLLEFLCGNCNRHLYEDPAKFPFRNSNPVPRLAGRLRCFIVPHSECRSLVSDPLLDRCAAASVNGASRGSGLIKS